MFVVSSVSSSISRRGQSVVAMSQNEDSQASGCQSTDDDASRASFEPDASDPHSRSVGLTEDDEGSYGGTIIASLSSNDVARNLLAEETRPVESRTCDAPVLRVTRQHPTALTRNRLSDVATVQSDVLSFTPTMAEYALSHHTTPVHTQSPESNGAASYSCSDAVSTIDIRDVQPDRVACPFCDREKDLQWRLSREREQSQDLKRSEYKARYFLFTTIITFVTAVVSFFVGKAVSDAQSEKAMAQYMEQCSELFTQKEGEELYWKLVTAAFSAMVNALAGPAANFVFGQGYK